MKVDLWSRDGDGERRRRRRMLLRIKRRRDADDRWASERAGERGEKQAESRRRVTRGKGRQRQAGHERVFSQSSEVSQPAARLLQVRETHTQAHIQKGGGKAAENSDFPLR